MFSALSGSGIAIFVIAVAHSVFRTWLRGTDGHIVGGPRPAQPAAPASTQAGHDATRHEEREAVRAESNEEQQTRHAGDDI